MRLTIVSAALALAACSSNVLPPPAAEACHLDLATDLPMLAPARVPVVPARLDGKPVSMLVDTGSEGMTILARAQRILGLAEDRGRHVALRGIGGGGMANRVIIQRFELGGVELSQPEATIAGDPIRATVDPPLAGSIGGDTLSGYDVELDFRTRRVKLWERSGCETVLPSWTGAWQTARLARGSGNLISLDVVTGGHNVRALLTTGAFATTLSLEAAARLGLTSARIAAARSTVSRGLDGNDVIAHVMRLDDVSLGGIHVHNLPVVVGPFHTSYSEMLLGVNFLEHTDLWLSYAGQQAFIR